MTDIELIAKQAKDIEELKATNNELSERIHSAILRIICIGGPLNDNVRRYNSEQLREWQGVLNRLES